MTNPVDNITEFAGLMNSPNDVSMQGGLRIADNVMIVRDNVIERRPGFAQVSTGLAASKILQVFSVDSATSSIAYAHNGSTLYYYDTAAFLWYAITLASGTTAGPSDTEGNFTRARRMRYAEYNGNLFFTSSAGINKLTSRTATGTLAGVPKSLDLVLSVTGASGFLANGFNVAYRLVWGRKDANNNLVVGAPSSRFVVANAAGATRNVANTFQIPAEITTSHFYQLYRTDQFATGTDPGDEQFLVYEANPTAGEITAQSITMTDITPDAFLGDALYTNATQQGIAQQNDRPPLARDIALFKDTLFYANTIQRHSKALNMVGTSAFVSGTSTITIGGVVFTVNNAAENVATGTFRAWSTAGGFTDLGTTALNVEATAKSLVKVINQYSSNTTVYAYYVSEADGVPGQIYIRERAIGGSAFSIICHTSITAMFSPNLPTSGTTYQSTNDEATNRLYYSKYQQPEHVPEAQWISVGPKNERIERVIALRDSLMVIKKRSVWRVSETGGATRFGAAILDDTVTIVGRDTAAKLNNEIYCLTTQGIVAISDNGVRIVSRAEENKLLPTTTGGYVDYAGATTNRYDFVGVGHERLRCYLLSMRSNSYGQSGPTGIDATEIKATYCYATQTNALTRWLISASSFAVVGDQLIYGGDYTTGVGDVFVERSSVTTSPDLISDGINQLVGFDDWVNVTGVSRSGNVISLTIGTQPNYGAMTMPAVNAEGAVLKHAVLNEFRFVTSGTAGSVTIEDATGFDASASWILLRPIETIVELAPRNADQPAMKKQYGDVFLVVEEQNARKCYVSFSNEDDLQTSPNAYDYYVDGSRSEQEVSVSAAYIKSSFFYSYPRKRLRTTVPKAKAISFDLAVRVRHRVAFSYFAIKAVCIETRVIASLKGKQ